MSKPNERTPPAMIMQTIRDGIAKAERLIDDWDWCLAADELEAAAALVRAMQKVVTPKRMRPTRKQAAARRWQGVRAKAVHRVLALALSGPEPEPPLQREHATKPKRGRRPRAAAASA